LSEAQNPNKHNLAENKSKKREEKLLKKKILGSNNGGIPLVPLSFSLQNHLLSSKIASEYCSQTSPNVLS